VLVALNAADVHRLPFVNTVLADATRRGMGVIGMKVLAAGRLPASGLLTAAESIGHVLSLPGVSNVIIGCKSPAEVDENAAIARRFTSIDAAGLRALEARTRADAETFIYYKRDD